MYNILKKYKLTSLHIMVVILGITGILGKLILENFENYDPKLGTIHLVWYRMGIAFVGLAFFLAYKKQLFRVSKEDFIGLLGVGALVTFHWLCFFESIKISNVSVAVVCLATSSLFSALIEPFFFKRKFLFYELVLGVVVVIALAFMIGNGEDAKGLSFKKEVDYKEFQKHIKYKGGEIRKDLGFDKETKSWTVEIDTKVLADIYGEYNPGNKKSELASHLTEDFPSVFIESVNKADNLWGYFYGILAALLATLFTLFNAKYINKVGAAKITMIEMLSGVIIISCILFFQKDYTVFKSALLFSDLSYLIILGVICTALAFVWLTEIMRHITPYTLIMAINLEPIYSIILALIIFGDNELMSSSFYFGSCLIIGIVFLDGYLKNKQ